MNWARPWTINTHQFFPYLAVRWCLAELGDGLVKLLLLLGKVLLIETQ